MKKESLERLKSLRILYVEDENEIRQNTIKSLKFFTQEVYEAENGLVGWEMYLKHKPDIIMTDILMPKLNGIELVRRIRQHDPHVCIVIITAHTDTEHLLGAIDLHLEQYIVKPITLDSLNTALSRCLARIETKKAFLLNLPSGYTYDIDHKVLSYEGETIKLNKKEILFFEILLLNSHRVVTYAELQEHVWMDDIMTDSALRTLVRSVRKKLPQDLITNLSGNGYRFATV